MGGIVVSNHHPRWFWNFAGVDQFGYMFSELQTRQIFIAPYVS